LSDASSGAFHKQLVESGYDRVADRYLDTKNPEDPTTLEALERLARNLPPGGAVLDLGCGAGIPATRCLAEKRFTVTGVDFSARQLQLARENVPAASFVKADMTDLDFAPESFDAVVVLHSIIHVPREAQPTLFANIHHWLKPGGSLLAALATTDFEGEESDREGWGAAMRWSHYGRETNEKTLRGTGFEVAFSEARTGRGTGDREETWLWCGSWPENPFKENKI
jgi:cyclopropane fatty-acyl-phospholipid synthase-like methyltransferase